MLDLVTNPEDRVSHDAAHVLQGEGHFHTRQMIVIKNMYHQGDNFGNFSSNTSRLL